MFEKLKGKKTYITGIVMILLFVLEKVLGIEIPHLEGNGNLLIQGILALSGRAAIGKIEMKN